MIVGKAGRFLDALHTLLAGKQQIIEESRTFQELGIIRQEWLGKLLAKSIPSPRPIVQIMNEIHLIHEMIIRQCVHLSIQTLDSAGMGDSPPVPYAFLLFGSGGRKEQTLISDQDNGLIYFLPEHLTEQEQQKIHLYFKRLSGVITQGLLEAGYPPCEGNVMAANTRWRGSIQHWTSMIDYWRNEPTWENIRYLLLVSDARKLAGNDWLLHELQQHLHHNISAFPHLVSRCVSNTLHHQVPLGWFNRLLPEIQGKYRGAINIKNGVYLPFVNCIRLFALANGIHKTSTLERLDELQRLQVWEPAFCQTITRQFQTALEYRLLAASQWHDELYQSNSYLKLAGLSKQQQSDIKSAMKWALRLQQLTTKTYAKAE